MVVVRCSHLVLSVFSLRSLDKYLFTIIGTLGWSLFIVLTWYSVFSPFKAFSTRTFSKWEHWQYGTFYNSAIGLAGAWLIYACHNNMGGKMLLPSDSVFSWRIIVVLISPGSVQYLDLGLQISVGVAWSKIAHQKLLRPSKIDSLLSVTRAHWIKGRALSNFSP